MCHLRWRIGPCHAKSPRLKRFQLSSAKLMSFNPKVTINSSPQYFLNIHHVFIDIPKQYCDDWRSGMKKIHLFFDLFMWMLILPKSIKHHRLFLKLNYWKNQHELKETKTYVDLHILFWIPSTNFEIQPNSLCVIFIDVI